ncbi:MAG: DUF4393 domain-containing protein, partial [Flavobacterium sp.]
PAIQKIGQALETVFGLSNTILLPLKLINEKARLNFQKHIDKYKEKLDKIDTEKIIDVPTILGTPIIDRLTYVTNEEIANLFINLLTKASSSDTINEAHPAFIHIIDRMTIDEARLINHLSELNYFPFINIIARNKENSHIHNKLAWNLTGLELEVELLCSTNIDTYLNNLESLKIIESQGKVYKTDELLYKNLEEKYSQLITEYNLWASSMIQYQPMCEIQKGFFEITELGKSFINACKQ